MKTCNLLLSTTLTVCSFSVFSQWQWVDASGHKVYSDRPPPAHISPWQILKQPSHTSAFAPNARYSGEERTTTASTAPHKKPTETDAPLPAIKTPPPDPTHQDARRQAEETEQKKHKAKQADTRRANCQRARAMQTSLLSGALHSHVNEKGERGLMTDAQRQVQLQRIQAAIRDNCR